jgi:nitrogen fixation/metabolism regulation signal transduction histidine kinase
VVDEPLNTRVRRVQVPGPRAGRLGPDYSVKVRTQWNATGGRVRLSVLDCGAGFTESILKRAFEPYITTKAKGTGLGLAVVKKIADEHGARIDLGNRLVDGAVLGAQVSLSFNTSTDTQILADNPV